MHVKHMLKMSRVYRLAEILRKIFVKKGRKIGDLIYDHRFDKLTISCQLELIKICYAITACTVYTFTFGKC